MFTLICFIILATTVGGLLIGDSKGRALDGLVLGFLFGIIGIIIIACMQPSRQVAQKRALEQASLTAFALGRSGWYADPYMRNQLRYFDGAAWGEYVSNHGVQTVDAVTA